MHHLHQSQGVTSAETPFRWEHFWRSVRLSDLLRRCCGSLTALVAGQTVANLGLRHYVSVRQF
jgi:hypothetical protein